MARTASPIWVVVVVILLGPLVMACLWRLMARGWAMGVQGGRASERVKRWERIEFRWLIVGLYAIGIVIVIVAFVKGTI